MKVNTLFQNKHGVLDNRFMILKELGSGGSSKVYKIKDSKNDKEYALKIFLEKEELFENEVTINKMIAQLNNPFFIKYISSSAGFLINGETNSLKHYIIFELCSKGNPIPYLYYNETGLEEKICKIFFYKILQCVKTLHKMGICHRDLKLDNFCLDGDCYNIKLGDFGLSTLIIRKKNGKAKKMTGNRGTEKYKAPEIFLEIPYDGEKADIFSLGVILFNLRTAKYGFLKAELVDFPKDIAEKLYNYIKEKKIETYWKLLEINWNISGLSEEFKKLYIKMVSYNPHERPTIEEIYNDEWMKEIRDLNEEEFKAYENEFIKELKKREKEMKVKKNYTNKIFHTYK